MDWSRSGPLSYIYSQRVGTWVNININRSPSVDASKPASETGFCGFPAISQLSSTFFIEREQYFFSNNSIRCFFAVNDAVEHIVMNRTVFLYSMYTKRVLLLLPLFARLLFGTAQKIGHGSILTQY
ncbi:hypothetical protein ABD67_19035 [Bacillus sonorensis]|nr:hypothetical protein [Bacillus sonorensis]